jgi:hypothetical protein
METDFQKGTQKKGTINARNKRLRGCRRSRLLTLRDKEIRQQQQLPTLTTPLGQGQEFASLNTPSTSGMSTKRPPTVEGTPKSTLSSSVKKRRLGKNPDGNSNKLNRKI